MGLRLGKLFAFGRLFFFLFLLFLLLLFLFFLLHDFLQKVIILIVRLMLNDLFGTIQIQQLSISFVLGLGIRRFLTHLFAVYTKHFFDLH
jgi:hypothetical protein